jgi:hypothetical protein
MWSVCAASEYEPDMLGLNDKKPGDTNGEGISAFGGSWFAVSGAGAKDAPGSQPQGGGGYGY